MTKTISPKIANETMIKVSRTVPSEQVFWTVDGRSFASLVELMQGIKVMEGRVYNYHADPKHQDFAKWINVVVGDRALSIQVKKSSSQKETYKIINHYLKNLK